MQRNFYLWKCRSLEQTLKQENEKKNKNEKLETRLVALHEARKQLFNISGIFLPSSGLS
jgi:hypothetical protein